MYLFILILQINGNEQINKKEYIDSTISIATCANKNMDLYNSL